MKKYGKLLTKISLIVLAVLLFLSLSLSDVIRLNPHLEGVPKAHLVSTAKKATVDEKVSVLIPSDELPEARTTEGTMEWSPEGYPELDINGDGEPDGFLLSYEDFAALGGQFLKDKYGAVRQVELEGVHYAQGRINNKGLLWQQLRFNSRALCALAVVYVPLIVLGAALLAAGLILTALKRSEEEGLSLGQYLWNRFSSRKVLRFISDRAIIVGILLMAALVSIFRPNFLSEANFRNLLSNTAVRFIIALGVSGCLITKGTDLSAGRVAGFAACLSAIFLQRAGDYSNKFYPALGNLPIPLVLLGVLAICALIGAINGTVIAKLKVPPFIATLGMQTLVYGICLVYTGAQPIGTLQSAYTGIALGYVGNRIFSYIAIIALVVGAFMWFLYNKTRHGKYMYTIGGVSVNGGVGKISGILVGVLVFEILKIALQFMGVESSYTYIAQGLVIIVAVALDLRKYLARK